MKRQTVRLLVLGTAFLVAVALLGPLGCGGAQLEKYGGERIQLTDADRDALAAATRDCLKDGDFNRSGFSKALTEKYNKDVFISLFAPGVESMRASGRRASVADSLKIACLQLREHPTYPQRYGKVMDKARLAIDIIDEVKPLTTNDPKKIAKIVEPGVHGLILDFEGKQAYQLGAEVMFNGWGMKGFGDRDRVMNKEMVEVQMKALTKAARVRESAWKDKNKAKVYYFTTHSFAERSPGKTFPTFRATELYPKAITRSLLLERAWLAARNLAKHVDKNGKFGYHYRAAKNEFTSGYNLVRHTGATWGLFQAYKATGDKTLLEAGRRALAYLEPNIKPAENNAKVMILVEGSASYLGSNALTTMALTEIPQELLTAEWKEKREGLGNSLIAMQADSGLFYGTWAQAVKKGPPPIPQPRYYPGEAFLTLVTLYETDGQKKWLDAAKKCADTQMREWDKNPKQQPDAWVVQAMSKLYKHTKDKRLPEYVFKMTAWHFEHQWGMPEKKDKMPYPDYFGGADNSTPPRSTPTSARNEANVEAWHLAKEIGDQEMMKKLGDSVLAAYWDNMIDQYLPDTAYYLPAPENAIGGIRGALIADDIRIDYNQHFSSSALNGLELAEERHGVGEFSPLAKGQILDVKKLGITPDEAAAQLAAGK